MSQPSLVPKSGPLMAIALRLEFFDSPLRGVGAFHVVMETMSVSIGGQFFEDACRVVAGSVLQRVGAAQVLN